MSSELVRNKPVSDEGIALDPNRVIGKSGAIERDFGAAALIVGMVRMGADHRYGIIDVRDSNSKAPFVIASLRNPGHRTDVHPDRSISVGGRKRTLRHPIKGVHEPHFQVAYDSEYDTFHVRGVHPKIGAFVTGHEVQPDEGAGVWANFTTDLQHVIRRDELYQTSDFNAPHGRYNGHPIIGAKSPSMKDGVYGTSNSEQLHVDNEDVLVAGIVNQTIVELKRGLEENPELTQRTILRYIKDEVREVLKYDLDGTNKMSEPYYEQRGMIHLSEYIKAEIGVCRHQAVLAALIMEEAISQGILRGTVGVQRNHVPELHGAHAWAVFRDERNHAIIVDPAQNYVGTRDEAKSDKRRWNYYISVDS